jgi:glycosyltransferase involved in cell wall biosynthesis
MMSTLRSRFSKLLRKIVPRRPNLYYVAPGSNWSLDWDAYYITRNVSQQFGLKAYVTKSASKMTDEIVHYASLWESAASLRTKESKRNKIVATIFHGQRDDPKFSGAIDQMVSEQNTFAKIHTSSKIMEDRLLSWGFSRKKLVCIPLGVDLKMFYPPTPLERETLRKEFGVPPNSICIGSFQKDGQGWAEGNEPKSIKGPDVFLDTLSILHRQYPIFVLLSAPARGYVKRGLEELGIPYHHVVEKDYLRIPRLYKAADIYLITSREEGGPKGALEALATGVPLVSTEVGLVSDLTENGKHGLLAKSGDSALLGKHVSDLIEHPNIRHDLSTSGLNRIKDFDWSKIAARYYQEIYAPLLSDQ